MAAALAIGSGCITRPDWIEQTLVTVDVTGIWQGTSFGGPGAYPPEELRLDLPQEGPKVKGSLRA